MRASWAWVAVAGLASGVAEAKDGRCTFEGKPADPLVVAVVPKGPAATPLKVRVRDATLKVRPELPGQPAHVDVAAALVFEGTADNVPYRVVRSADVNGIFDLPVGTSGLRVHRQTRGRLLDLELTIGDLEVKGLAIGCESIGIATTAAPELSAAEETGDRVVPAAQTLHLQQRANGGAKALIEMKGSPEGFELRVLESEGKWKRVTARWLDGIVLTGYVAKEEVRAAPPPTPQGEMSPPIAQPCTPDTTPASQPRSRIVVATVAPGTQVFASRYVGPWAKVQNGEGITIRYRQKDDWVELVNVPGIASDAECVASTVLHDAWVPRSAVKLPASEDSAVWPDRE